MQKKTSASSSSNQKEEKRSASVGVSSVRASISNVRLPPRRRRYHPIPLSLPIMAIFDPSAAQSFPPFSQSYSRGKLRSTPPPYTFSGPDATLRKLGWCTHKNLPTERGGGGGDPTTGKWLHPHRPVSDFIVFNGQIYACEYNGVLYVLDDTKVELIPLIPLIPACNIARPGTMFWMRLVVWDGGLYAVAMYTDTKSADCFRLVEDEGNCRWEKVEDLGGGVLFFTRDCVFSMSARDLPRPWRGNSIVVARRTWTTCCIVIIEVYELGVEGGKSKPISSIPGYSKLFAPPLTRS